MTAALTASRQAVLDAARSYLGTPFHMSAAVKNVGVDCGTFLIGVYGSAGIAVPRVQDLGVFKRDWHMHTSEQRYLKILEPFARPVEKPEPGDIVLFAVGAHKVWAHAGIVIDPPLIIDARWNHGVQYSRWDHGTLGTLPRMFLSPFTPERTYAEFSLKQ